MPTNGFNNYLRKQVIYPNRFNVFIPEIDGVTLYTGNGSIQSITGLGYSPDLVWCKSLSNASNNILYDTTRGVEEALIITTAQEFTETDGVTSFDADGFTTGSDSRSNFNAWNYMAWTWEESVANGFDIVTWTGNQTNRTISHNLGVAPRFIITKALDSASSWWCYHEDMGNDKSIQLDTDNAYGTSSTFWQDTSPTSSVFSLGTSINCNETGTGFVGYVFANKTGISHFGSYTGNGSASGPIITAPNFKPGRLIIRRASASFGSYWSMIDSARGDGFYVLANESDAQVETQLVDFTDVGFDVVTTDANVNSSGATYIYMLWAA
ncbi:hypothetical protein KAR91_53645 [Candidatus Pacearchaeota archaeon]|nr:hypothetical protein [Candidatus Pacearchaeota archaeon]